MPGIGIINNPHSRRNRKFPEQMRRMGYILGQHDSYELTNKVEDIEKVAHKFMESDIEILALNGGDGTNHATLTRFINVYGDRPLPRIAFLRGGTMNTVSDGVGVRGTPARLLANLVEKYYTKQPFETTVRDTFRLRDENGVSYGFIFGNGVISNFLELYYATGNPSPIEAARLLSQGVYESARGRGEVMEALFRPFRAHIAFEDGSTWPDQDYVSIFASTIEQIGLGFRPFTRCEERVGAFHILGAHASPLEIIKTLPGIRLGLPIPEEVMYSRVTSHVTFTSDKPITYTIDGELHTAYDGFLELGVGPRVEIILK